MAFQEEQFRSGGTVRAFCFEAAPQLLLVLLVLHLSCCFPVLALQLLLVFVAGECVLVIPRMTWPMSLTRTQRGRGTRA